MRGSAIARKKKQLKLGGKSRSAGLETKSKSKTKKLEKKLETKKLEKKRGRASRSSRDERDDEDDAEESRGRFAPPPKKDSTMLVVAIVAALLIVVGVAAMGGGGSNLVDEHEAEKAYNYVDGQYALAKGGDALAENRGALRSAFQKVVDAYPGTESAEKAEKRIRELQ